MTRLPLCLMGSLALSMVGGRAVADNLPAAVKIAAASDLAPALVELGAAWERKTGQKITVVLGSSGMLARQLEQGAPFDALLAADLDSVDAVIRASVCAADSRRVYARGRLAIWAQQSTALAALTDANIRRIAIANPAHAPYGRAAEAALRKAGLWDRLQPKLVYADNVQRAFELAHTGNADVALVAVSLTKGAGGATALVDAKLHPPLDQAAVACGPRARDFVAYLASPEAQAILAGFGFETQRRP